MLLHGGQGQSPPKVKVKTEYRPYILVLEEVKPQKDQSLLTETAHFVQV